MPILLELVVQECALKIIEKNCKDRILVVVPGEAQASFLSCDPDEPTCIDSVMQANLPTF